MEKTDLKDNELKMEFSGYDITNERPVYYKSKDSNQRDFYLIHAYTPEHFTLLRYMEVAGIVTTHFSTINDKYELQEMVVKGAHKAKKLKLITREEYLFYKNIYDNYMKSIHI